MSGYLIGALVVLLILGAAGVLVIFNGLVSLRNEIRRSWSNIDVLLKQRFDEIPRLVEVCKGYMKHEREVLQLVVEARSMIASARGLSEQTRAEDGLSDAIRSLFAVVERYPDLKANESFLKLQQRISELENQIADRREFYNQFVTAYNTRRESFPDLLVAGPFGFKPAEWWKVRSAAERRNPAVDLRPS
jgi:LemA protein